MRAVLVLGGVLLAAPVFAYTAVPITSFAKPTPSGKYVLVMLHSFGGGAGKNLKEKYGRSGLYPRDDPKNPVWTCEWKAERERNVFASDDGIFAVHVPDGDPGERTWQLMNDKPIPSKRAGWESEPALVIYRHGKPFRTLALRDVFDCTRFTDRDCFMGPIVTIDSFLDGPGHVTISSEANERKQTATIDFRTGKVISGSGLAEGPYDLSAPGGGSGEPAGGRSWLWALVVGLVIVGAGAAALVWNRRVRRG
jgi:hypothetical protein